MRKHQLKLPDRQCRMAELSQRVQDVVTILVTALWAWMFPALRKADRLTPVQVSQVTELKEEEAMR